MVLEDKINVRVDSTVLSDSLGQLSKDQRVEVSKEKYDWYNIILPRSFECYVSLEFTEEVSDTVVRINASKVNLRSQPSLESNIMGVAPRDATFLVTGKNKNWLRVRGHPYLKGWVHKKFLEQTEEDFGLPLFVADIISALPDSDMTRKKALHRELISKGEEVIPILESYVYVADPGIAYSIIAVLTEFGQSNPSLATYFLKKTETFSLRAAAVYLDIAQELIPFEGEKKAYFYLIQEGELSFDDIEKGRESLRQEYDENLHGEGRNPGSE